MSASRYAMAVVLACLCSSAAAIKEMRSENDMELEEVEFPFPAIDDSVAGAPGAAAQDTHVAGPAHTTSIEAASDPCDMTGSSTNLSPGEDPFSQGDGEVVSSVVVDPKFPLGAATSQYACLATTFTVELDPRVDVPFNLYNAQFEGNDRAGAASSAEFEVTDCGCVCSGLNSACGRVGSTSYYSNVVNTQQCAQMVCHKNQFSHCFWKGDLNALGHWVGNVMVFNTTAFQYIVEKLHPHAANSTKNSTGLLGRIPSPSPSPSSIPTFEDLVNQRAMAIIGILSDKACVQMDREAIREIAVAIRELNSTSDPLIVCESEVQVTPILNAQLPSNSEEFVDDALAGFAGSSPLAGDATRHASLSMNTNVQPTVQLLDMGEDDDVTQEAFNKVVLLFRNNVRQEVQCQSWIPPMATLLADALALSRNCSHQTVSLMIQHTNFTELTEQVVQYTLTSVIVHLKPALGITAKRPPPPTTPVNPADAINDMNAPVFPPSAPGPSDLSADPNAAITMEGVLSPECDDTEVITAVANLPSTEETELPGARVAANLPNYGKAELPLFGRQKLEWDARSPGVVTLNQPPELDAS